jgi:hypothetical protein
MINCASPANNHQGNASCTVTGIINKPAPPAPGGPPPAGNTFGTMVDLSGIDAACPLAPSRVILTLRKNNSATVGYVEANCTPAGPNPRWHLRTVFDYTGPPTPQAPVFTARTCS